MPYQLDGGTAAVGVVAAVLARAPGRAGAGRGCGLVTARLGCAAPAASAGSGRAAAATRSGTCSVKPLSPDTDSDTVLSSEAPGNAERTPRTARRIPLASASAAPMPHS